MKKIISLFFGILLISFLFGMAIAAQGQNQGNFDGNGADCNSNNLDLCTGENECEDAGGNWESGYCLAEDKDKDNNNSNLGLGQTIRNRVKAGIYTSETGEKIRVRELAQNRLRLEAGNFSADCDCNLTQEQVQNRTRLKVQLSNGRNAEVKVMPDTAAERALERLRLRNCNSENNCSIELKETGREEQTRLAYELQAERHSRIFGLFKAKMRVRAEINAENGEIEIKKPWWAFLAYEPGESE